MKYVSDSNLSRFFQKLKGIFAKKADVDAKMTNPMTAVGDIIIGGTNGAATRLAKANTNYYQYLVSRSSDTGGPTWQPAVPTLLYIEANLQNKTFYVNDNTAGIGKLSYGKPGLDFGLGILTTAPTADNTDGIKIVVLSAEPSNYYNGFLYLIQGT